MSLGRSVQVQIKGADELRRDLKRAGEAILPFIAPVLEQRAQHIRSLGIATAPKDTGALLISSFVDSVVDRRALTALASTGYEAPHAPYVHEGVHYGRQLHPPKWLEHAADGQAETLASEVGDAIMDALAKHFRK